MPTGSRPRPTAARACWGPWSSLGKCSSTTRCTTSTCGTCSRGEPPRSEEHTSELQSRENVVCRLLLEKKKPTGSAAAGRASASRRTSTAGTGGFDASRVRWLSTLRRSVVAGGASERFLFFFNDTATTEIYTLSLHDALPI